MEIDYPRIDVEGFAAPKFLIGMIRYALPLVEKCRTVIFLEWPVKPEKKLYRGWSICSPCKSNPVGADPVS
jgi:hypothetical protein